MSNTFYGNMVNLLNAQFQFDKEYSNYVELKNNETLDNVYVGRHALIRYENTPNNLTDYKNNLLTSTIFNLENSSGIGSNLFNGGATVYNFNTDVESNKIIVPIYKYKNNISWTNDIINITFFVNNMNKKIVISAKEDIDFNDYEFDLVVQDNSVKIGYKTKDALSEFTYITGFEAESCNLVKIDDAAPFKRLINITYSIDSDDNLMSILYQGKIGNKLAVSHLIQPEFTYSDAAVTYVFVDKGQVRKLDNDFIVCDGETNYYFETDDDDLANSWWAYDVQNDYHPNIYYKKEETVDSETGETAVTYKEESLYQKSETSIYQSAIQSKEYNKKEHYFYAYPVAHFKTVTATDNFALNELIDNTTDTLFNYEAPKDYDLTVWKKQFVDQTESYAEVTGFKLPNMTSNMAADTVLSITDKNKIVGKQLRGVGKMAVTYQDDTIDISHEKSPDLERILGDYSSDKNEVRTLNFPVPDIKLEYGKQPGDGEEYKNITDPDIFDTNYRTSVISVAPDFSADFYIDYFIEGSEEMQSIDPKTAKENVEKNPDSGMTTETIDAWASLNDVLQYLDIIEGKTNVRMVDFIFEESFHIVYKIVNNSFIKTENNYTIYKTVDEGDAVYAYYNADPNNKATYFSVPAMEIDDYGHVDKSRNIVCQLPALEGDKFSVEFSNLDANYAKIAGEAQSLSPIVQFQIGKTIRTSGNPDPDNGSKIKYYWDLEDLGFEIGYESDNYSYPIASRVLTGTDIIIGNQTQTLIAGETSQLNFTLEDIGAIPLAQDADENTPLVNGTKATISSSVDKEWNFTREGVELDSLKGSFKIGEGFSANADSCDTTLSKVILKEGITYGNDLPADPVEGQLFFKLEYTEGAES